MLDLDDYSRFRQTEMVIVDGKETFGRWRPISILTTRPSEEFIEAFQVTSALEGRPDLISQAIYGTPLLDWLLIAFNNVREPINWPRTGDVIEYPIESIVLPSLL